MNNNKYKQKRLERFTVYDWKKHRLVEVKLYLYPNEKIIHVSHKKFIMQRENRYFQKSLVSNNGYPIYSKWYRVKDVASLQS